MDKRRALCIEGEPATATLVAQALEPFGFEVEVMDDGNEGIARAKEYAPEVIVLCVELPGANGFSVCNKLKKAPETRAIPVILTSDAGPDAFESHRRLKTHADEYLVKPFTAEELLEKADALVGLGAPTAAEGVVETEEISLSEGEYLMEEEVAEAVVDGEEHVVPFEEPSYGTAAPSEADHVAAAASAARIAELEAENARLRHDLESAVPTPRPPAESSRIAELEAEVERLRMEAERARRTPAAPSPRIAELEAEVERLRHDLDHAKTAPKDTVFSRDRELLSLREVIARKDKDILDLKDALDSKDRHVLDQKDRVRAAERKLADVEERQLGMERELVQAREERQAAMDNEEKSHEREKAVKARLEEAKAEVVKAHAENDELRAQKKQEADAREAAHREEVEAVTRRLKADLTTVEQIRDQTIAEIREQHAVELRTAGERAAAELAAREEALRGEAGAAAAEAERRFQQEKAELEGRHAAALEAVARREADARAGMEQRHKGEIEEVRAALADLQQKHAGLEGQLAEAKGRTAQVERQLSEVQRALAGRESQVADLEQSNAAFQDQLLRVTARLKGTEQSNERARKALAIALTLLDSGGEGAAPGAEDRT